MTRARADRTTTVMVGVAAALAGGITLYQWTRPGLLFGEGPDISAYFGGAVRLVHGVLPYRDFVQVEPPGFQLLVSPVALLTNLIGTRNGLAVVRLLMIAVAVLNVILVGRLLRGRSPTAVFLACGVTALAPAVGYALHTVLLEPIVALVSLLGASLVFDGDSMSSGRRRLMAGGLALGFAATIKLPGLVIVAVVICLCLLASRRRAVLVAAGALAGFLLPMLPFLALSPAAFIRDVFASQLGRVGDSGRASVGLRFSEITGASAFTSSETVAIAVTLGVVVLIGGAFAARRHQPTLLEWFAITSSLAACAVQLIPAQYYSQYAAFAVPFVALAVGVAVDRVVGPGLHRAGLAVVSLALTALLVNQVGQLSAERGTDIAAAVDAVIPAGACTLGDSPNKLVTTDRFTAGSPGCTTMTDTYGTGLVLRWGSPAYLVAWRAALVHADYFVGQPPLNLDPRLRPYLAANFRLVTFDGLLFYLRNGFPRAAQR